MQLLDLAARLGFVTPRPEIATRSETVIEPTVTNDPLIPSRTSITVTEDLALSVDAVYRAVAFIQTAFSQLVFEVKRAGVTIASPIAEVPCWYKSLPAWMAETVASLALRGNAYWLVTRNPLGQPLNVEVLAPDECVVVGTYRAPRVSWRGVQHDARTIVHLAIGRRPGRLMGLSPIDACNPTVSGVVALRRWADNWLDDAHVPTGILTSDQSVTPDDAVKAKQAFRTGTARYGDGPVVLGQGLSYDALLLTPEQMQFLAAQRANVVSIARMFGVPGRALLVVPEGGTDSYANLSQDILFWIRYSGMLYVREIEEAFSRWVLPAGQTARLNLDVMQRPDILTRYQAAEIGVRAGWLDPDEVRADEGRPPRTTPAP